MRIAVILTAVALVLVMAVLARIDGATYPQAITRAAIAFATTLTLAATVTAALTTVIS